ncbi:hypothetical protein HID58_062096 [Brassica napus]|uniref:Ribosomal protein L37 n=2 Tax=Brassica TaxID=3705 RepID=A0ABQ8A1L0_BRANA|nr:hypothetical protein HID58_062096 [Brassica napus]
MENGGSTSSSSGLSSSSLQASMQEFKLFETQSDIIPYYFVKVLLTHIRFNDEGNREFRKEEEQESHTLCERCGRRSFHIQKSRCFTCAYSQETYNWSVKTIRRKTTGTGRMRYLRNVPRRFKTSFREGTEAKPRNKAAASSA